MKILIIIFLALILVLIYLLGIFSFLAILLFLSAMAGIGKLIEIINSKSRFHFFLNRNPVLRFCFFTVLGMEVVALVVLLYRVFFISQFPVLLVLNLVGIIFGAVYIVKKRKIIFKREFWFFLNKNWISLTVLLLLVCVIAISSYMLKDDKYYYFQDAHHPIYELSIAKAVDLNIPPADLSYQGKSLKFHFASSILISIFYKYFSINQLEVVYRIFPLISIFLFIPLFIYLLILSGIKKGLFLPIATGTALFVSPFIIPLFGFLGIFADSPNIFRSITITPSYAMGYLGFLVLLIVIIETIKMKRFFSIIICILSVGLLMSKASFFIPLALGVSIWSLHRAWIIKKWRPLILPLSMFIVSAPFFISFLAGAHSYNQWILVPDRLIFRGLPNWIPGAGSILRFPIMFFATPLALLGLLSVVYIFGFVYVWKKRTQTNNPEIMLLIIIMLVSSTLPLFITEITEGNNRQFFYPGFLLLWIFFFKRLSLINFKKYQKIGLTIILVLGFLSQQISFIWSSPLPSYDIELVEALRYIKNNSKEEDVFLIGKHYEYSKFRERKYVGEWNTDSFFRTAISGRQTVIENFKYRSIGMESDYNKRSLDNFKFYYLSIDHTEASLLGWDVPLGYEPPVSKREQRANLSYVKPLWLGRGKNWFDIRKSFPQFLENNWDQVIRSSYNEQWLLHYFAQYNIMFILFERGEKPKQRLVDLLNLDLVYNKGAYTIYGVK